jgi:hypothetical protein
MTETRNGNKMNDQRKTKEQLINELNELKEELALFKH